MPLSFLNPGLLLGAAAAALPVLLHFLSRRRVRRQVFSDLRFLEQAQSRQARSLGVRRWLLLLLRVLALLAIVMGVAGPRWGGLSAAAGGGSYLLVLDASASSQARRGAGTVLEAAVADAGAMIRQLPSGATVQVMVAGSRTEALFGDWLPAGEATAAALAAIQPTDGGFDLGAVLLEATRQAVRAPGAPVDLILIGDLQSVPADPAWRSAAEAMVRARPVRVLLREVAADDGANGGVTAVSLPHRALQPGEIALVQATVVASRAGQVFTLELDGRAVAEAVTTGPAGSPGLVEFALSVPAPGLHAGWVRKESDALPVDDRRPFVLAVPGQLDVLIVHGTDRPGDGAAGRGGWRYLSRALAPGGAGGPFAVTSWSSDDVTTGALAAAGVIALVDPGPLGRVGQGALEERLSGGGGVLLAAGDPLVAGYLSATLLPALGLPGPATPRTGGGDGVHARVVDAAHPLLAGFDEAALRTVQDLGWRRWLAIEPGDGQVVLELTGGDPLLVTRTVGEGRLAVLATHLQPEAGDLVRSPMALPTLQRLASWLGRDAARDGAAELLAGQEARVRPRLAPGATLGDAGSLLAVGPAAGAERATELTWRGATPQLSAGAVDRAGFVVFLSGADTLGLAAVAVPPAPSRRPVVSAGGWRDRLGAVGLEVAADLSGSDPSRLPATLAGRDLAPWAFALAALLLAAELAVGSGAGKGPGGGS